MIAVLPGNVAMEDPFAAGIFYIADNLAVSLEVQIDTGYNVVVWLLSEQLDNVSPMHLKCEAIARGDSVSSTLETLSQLFPDLFRASAWSARIDQLAQCVDQTIAVFPTGGSASGPSQDAFIIDIASTMRASTPGFCVKVQLRLSREMRTIRDGVARLIATPTAHTHINRARWRVGGR